MPTDPEGSSRRHRKAEHRVVTIQNQNVKIKHFGGFWDDAREEVPKIPTEGQLLLWKWHSYTWGKNV